MISKSSHKQQSIPAVNPQLFRSIDREINSNNTAAKVVYLANGGKGLPTDVSRTLNKRPGAISQLGDKSHSKSNKLFREGVNQLLNSLNARSLQLPPELRVQLANVLDVLAAKDFDCTRTNDIRPVLATLVEVERLLDPALTHAGIDATASQSTQPDAARPGRPVQPLPSPGKQLMSVNDPNLSTPRHTPSNAATRTRAVRERAASQKPADAAAPKMPFKVDPMKAGLRDRMFGDFYTMAEGLVSEPAASVPAQTAAQVQRTDAEHARHVFANLHRYQGPVLSAVERCVSQGGYSWLDADVYASLYAPGADVLSLLSTHLASNTDARTNLFAAQLGAELRKWSEIKEV